MRSSARKVGIGTSPFPDPDTVNLRLEGFGISIAAKSKSMKQISISLYGTLRMIKPDFADRNLVQTKARSVGELFGEVNIPKGQAAIVFVNEKRARFDSEIQDGDNIKIFPMLGGG
jgi:molybdopterin converting factor small subunit